MDLVIVISFLLELPALNFGRREEAKTRSLPIVAGQQTLVVGEISGRWQSGRGADPSGPVPIVPPADVTVIVDLECRLRGVGVAAAAAGGGLAAHETQVSPAAEAGAEGTAGNVERPAALAVLQPQLDGPAVGVGEREEESAAGGVSHGAGRGPRPVGRRRPRHGGEGAENEAAAFRLQATETETTAVIGHREAARASDSQPLRRSVDVREWSQHNTQYQLVSDSAPTDLDDDERGPSVRASAPEVGRLESVAAGAVQQLRAALQSEGARAQSTGAERTIRESRAQSVTTYGQ